MHHLIPRIDRPSLLVCPQQHLVSGSITVFLMVQHPNESRCVVIRASVELNSASSFTSDSTAGDAGWPGHCPTSRQGAEGRGASAHRNTCGLAIYPTPAVTAKPPANLRKRAGKFVNNHPIPRTIFLGFRADVRHRYPGRKVEGDRKYSRLSFASL